MKFCVVDVEPNFIVLCTDSTIQKQGNGVVKYFFGHDDEEPNFEAPLSKTLCLDRSSLHAGTLLAEFDEKDNAIKYGLKMATESARKVRYVNMESHVVKRGNEKTFNETDEPFSGQFEFKENENGDREYNLGINLSKQCITDLKNIVNLKEKDYRFVEYILEVVFSKEVLQNSSALGTTSNNSGKRHDGLKPIKRNFVEELFNKRVMGDLLRKKTLYSLINRKCNSLRKKRTT